MASATGPAELEAAEQAENKLQAKKSMWMTKRWRKWRDAPLGDVVAAKLRRRAERGMGSPAESEARSASDRRHATPRAVPRDVRHRTKAATASAATGNASTAMTST